MHRSFMVLSDRSTEKSKIMTVNDILESEIPELPLETSFKVNWLVVGGRQVGYLKESMF